VTEISPAELKPGDVVVSVREEGGLRVTVLRAGGAPGSRPVITDVASHANVSVKTVSRVLNGEGNVSPQLAARVTAAVEALGFTRNAAAYSLRAGKTKGRAQDR
jgi:hypothetical protein